MAVSNYITMTYGDSKTNKITEVVIEVVTDQFKSISPRIVYYNIQSLKKIASKSCENEAFCAPSRTRTGDLMIKSHMLYQLSYGCGAKLQKSLSFRNILKQERTRIYL